MRLLSVIFLLVGIGLLVGASFPLRTSLELVESGQRVEGVVVSYKETHDDDGPSYAPIYRFEFGGSFFQHEASVSTSSAPVVGSTETLLVDPTDPTLVKPDTFMGLWFIATILGGLGVLFTLIGLGSALGGLALRRKIRRAETGHFSLEGEQHSTSQAHTEAHEREADMAVKRAARRREEQTSSHRGPFL